jgi:hypothetical protein
MISAFSLIIPTQYLQVPQSKKDWSDALHLPDPKPAKFPATTAPTQSALLPKS